MTSEASYQLDDAPPAPGRGQTPFTILLLVLVILTMVMILVWLYAEFSAITAAIANQTPGPWAGFAWAAIWGLMAALGACGVLVPGLILCVRPALLARIAPGSVLSRLSGFRRWPRLTGLTYLWAGVWVVTFALTTVTQAFRAPREPFPPFSNMAFVAVFAMAALPGCTLMLAGRLVRRRSQRPVAEDGPPARQGQ